MRPLTLLVNRLTLENRLKVLNECSFKDIQLLFVYRFISIMNREIKVLKAFDYIDHRQHVVQNLLNIFDIPITVNKQLGEDMTLNSLREIVINQYLKVCGVEDKTCFKINNVFVDFRRDLE